MSEISGRSVVTLNRAWIQDAKELWNFQSWNEALHREIESNTTQAKTKQKEYYDRGKSHRKFQVGDVVLVQAMNRGDSLSPLYQGP